MVVQKIIERNYFKQVASRDLDLRVRDAQPATQCQDETRLTEQRELKSELANQVSPEKVDANLRIEQAQNIEPPPQFVSRQELDAYYEGALQKSAETYASSIGTNRFTSLVENSQRPNLSQIAKEAKEAGLSSQQTGNLVHRVSELWTLKNKSNDLINGVKYVECPVGERGAGGEIDLITRRGDKYYIHDYKPIHVSDALNEPWGGEFQKWLQDKHQGDITRIKGYQDMPSSLKANWKQYLSDQMRQHRHQLTGYRESFCQEKGLTVNKVIPAISPYFVW